jgi:molecular chaperone GrpE
MSAPRADHDGPGQVPGDADAPLEVRVEVETPSAPHAPPGEPTAGAADPPPAVDRVGELEAALVRADQERKDSHDKYLRALADLQNFQRRSKRDLDDARAEARTRVLKEMLPVVDNLERGLQHAESAAAAGDLAGIVDGVRLVLRQFGHAFERCDVRPVEADGAPFDPNVHEAISQQESTEQAPGTVLQVLQRGYTLGDRLLRPALVVVAKAPPAPAVEPPEGD